MTAEASHLTNFVLKTTCDYFYVNPREYTYIGIGSGPRFTKLTEFVEEVDQIIPVFVRDIINNTDKTIRIIHFDVEFERHFNFLQEYFAVQPYDLEYDNTENVNRWVSQDHRIEIIIYNMNFYHENNTYSNEYANQSWFLEELIKSVLSNNYQLVLQQYSGLQLDQIAKNMYHKFANKDLYKKKILFDITYGVDCHCGTDMKKYKPYYDNNYDFYNLFLFSEYELKNVFGVNPDMDEYIRIYYVKKYKELTNKIIVDYRRKMQNIPIDPYKNKYNNDSSTDTIMMVLQNEIKSFFNIFNNLNMITPEKNAIIQELFTNYKNYGLNTNPSIYKWSDMLYNLF
jgi:hypothetical protein